MAISHVEIYRAVVGQLTSLNANRVCRMNHLNVTIKNRMYTTDLGNIGVFFLHETTIVSIFVLILNEGVIFWYVIRDIYSYSILILNFDQMFQFERKLKHHISFQ